jgi:hypothetical protein
MGPPPPPPPPAKPLHLPAALTPCQVDALKRCLELHSGDQAKCAKEIEAFKAVCGQAAEAPPSTAAAPCAEQ